MSVEETILQAFRSWLKDAQSLTDAQVIPEDDDGPRPPKPYLTVSVLTLDNMVNMDDEELGSLDGSSDPQVKTRGQRNATVSVQGFGADTADWLADARLAIRLPAAQAIFDAANLSVAPMGGTSTDNPRIDTILEDRYLMEFDVYYGLESSNQAQYEAEKLEIEMTWETPPTDINETIIVEAP
jgi:hypothetical protein